MGKSNGKTRDTQPTTQSLASSGYNLCRIPHSESYSDIFQQTKINKHSMSIHNNTMTMEVPVWARMMDASGTASAVGEPRLNRRNPLGGDAEFCGIPFLVDIPDEVSTASISGAYTRLRPRGHTSSGSDSDGSTGYLEERRRPITELESASRITRPASAPPALPASMILPMNWSSPLLTPAFSSAVTLPPSSAELSTRRATGTASGAPRPPLFRLQKRSIRLQHQTEDLDNSLTGFMTTAALRNPGSVFQTDLTVVGNNNNSSSDDIHSCAAPPETPPRGSSSAAIVAPTDLCLSSSLFMPTIG